LPPSSEIKKEVAGSSETLALLSKFIGPHIIKRVT
jgi:hypothetical protein